MGGISEGTIAIGLWGIVVALIGVVWGTLKERNKSAEIRLEKLEAQNTAQETAIGRVTERVIAREDVHAQHREDMKAQFDRIDVAMGSMNTKLDTLLRGYRGGTPYPEAGRKT